MLLFYILQNNYLNRLPTLFQDAKLNSTTAASNSSSPIRDCTRKLRSTRLRCILRVRKIFHENWSIGSKVEMEGGGGKGL
jgi:hypothetical protein